MDGITKNTNTITPMLRQLDIFEIHQRENRPENQAHLDENRDRWSAQCHKVYALLRSGVRLSRLQAANVYSIMSLERRIADLIANGVEIQKEWVRNSEGKKLYIEYYI